MITSLILHRNGAEQASHRVSWLWSWRRFTDWIDWKGSGGGGVGIDLEPLVGPWWAPWLGGGTRD